MGQEAMPDLPSMTDKTLKAILESTLSLDKLDDALQIAKHRLEYAQVELAGAQSLARGHEEHRERVEARISVAMRMLATEQDELLELHNQAAESDSGYQQRVDEFNARIEKLKAEVSVSGAVDREAGMLEIEKALRINSRSYPRLRKKLTNSAKQRGKPRRIIASCQTSCSTWTRIPSVPPANGSTRMQM
ncbi:hypothetical protein [Xanthomonas phage JGB6]|nr:hypothetical protein [Xanthomonas phage JGB6]